MQSGQLLVNGSDFYCGNSTNSLCQLALRNQIPSQYVHPANKVCNYSVDTSQFVSRSDFNSLKNSIGTPCKITTIYDGWYSYTAGGSSYSGYDTTFEPVNYPSTDVYSIHKGIASSISISMTMIDGVDSSNSVGYYVNLASAMSSTDQICFNEYTDYAAGTTVTKSFDNLIWLSSNNVPSLGVRASYSSKMAGTHRYKVTFKCYLKIVQLSFS